ncbi:hypothetical protein [Sulfurimonas sp.]|uniref:hypothetical protein n=1 Tax=Sulfurimonas sp. TaxID=2022749 RepID=UPI0025E79E2E|nr:hypothetical protein [Sulfurimonas sp.]
MENSYVPERYWKGGNKLLIIAIVPIISYGLIYHLVFSYNFILFCISSILLIAPIYFIFWIVEITFNRYWDKNNIVYTIAPLIVTVLFSIFLIDDGRKNASELVYTKYENKYYHLTEEIKEDGQLSNYEYFVAEVEDWNEKRKEKIRRKEFAKLEKENRAEMIDKEIKEQEAQALKIVREQEIESNKRRDEIQQRMMEAKHLSIDSYSEKF